jgi:N utilization substance protein A
MERSVRVIKEMITHDDLTKLAKMGQKSLSLPEEELISFVKNGAVRAYKAAGEGRETEEVKADFNPQTKQLRLVVRKKVVAEVTDDHKECTEAVGKTGIGQTADIEITDTNTYQAIKAGYDALRELLSIEWKKHNSLAVKTKYQEVKGKCVPATVTALDGDDVTVSLTGEIDALLPKDGQLNEKYEPGNELIVYVKELKEQGSACDLIVSRNDSALVSYAMRRHIPEVDLGNIEIKAVARLSGDRSRVAVWSKDFSPTERCQKRADKVMNELGGENIDFIEWYQESKSYIVSALKVEAREVHVIEPEKQALVEVFKDSAEQALDQEGKAIKLAEQLTGYKIEVKLCAREDSGGIPGV